MTVNTAITAADIIAMIICAVLGWCVWDIAAAAAGIIILLLAAVFLPSIDTEKRKKYN